LSLFLLAAKEKRYCRVVSVGQLSFGSRSYSGSCRRMHNAHGSQGAWDTFTETADIC